LPGSTHEPVALFPKGRPELPTQLSPLQQVQLSDLLSYVHERIGLIIKHAVENEEATGGRMVQVDWESWTKQISLMSDLAEYIKTIHSPE